VCLCVCVYYTIIFCNCNVAYLFRILRYCIVCSVIVFCEFLHFSMKITF
jgi:hypothetical protein